MSDIRILIYGLNNEQERSVTERCADLPVRLICRHQPKRGTAPQADYAIITRWTDHTSTDVVQKAGLPWTIHRGGVTGLVRLIEERVALEQDLFNATATPIAISPEVAASLAPHTNGHAPPAPTPTLYTAGHLAREVGVEVAQIKAWAAAGRLPTIGDGKRRFPAEALESALDIATTPSPPSPPSPAPEAPARKSKTASIRTDAVLHQLWADIRPHSRNDISAVYKIADRLRRSRLTRRPLGARRVNQRLIALGLRSRSRRGEGLDADLTRKKEEPPMSPAAPPRIVPPAAPPSPPPPPMVGSLAELKRAIALAEEIAALPVELRRWIIQALREEA